MLFIAKWHCRITMHATMPLDIAWRFHCIPLLFFYFSTPLYAGPPPRYFLLLRDSRIYFRFSIYRRIASAYFRILTFFLSIRLFYDTDASKRRRLCLYIQCRRYYRFSKPREWWYISGTHQFRSFSLIFMRLLLYAAACKYRLLASFSLRIIYLLPLQIK